VPQAAAPLNQLSMSRVLVVQSRTEPSFCRRGMER
jgi:hypothetical protein